jgi:hypothetical protein
VPRATKTLPRDCQDLICCMHAAVLFESGVPADVRDARSEKGKARAREREIFHRTAPASPRCGAAKTCQGASSGS